MVEESCRIVSAAEYARQQEALRQMRETIDALRMSRRILMSLLEDSQLRLERETRQLKAEQQRLAKKKARIRQELAEKEEELDSITEQMDACAPEDYMLLAEFSEQKDLLEEEMLLLMEELEDLENR